MNRRRTPRTGGTPRDFPRTARLNRLLLQIVADEIERLDDERLGFLTVTAVEVEPDLRHATVWYSRLEAPDDAPDEDAVLREALAELRPRLQAAVARQARLKRTPELAFAADEVMRTATRVEGIIREWHDDEPQ